MVQRYDAIQTADWQPKLGELGGIAEDEADIDQCIKTILGTPKGAVPHRPLFGSELHLYVDYPIAEAGPHLVRESVDALTIWEPRIVVDKVTPSRTDAGTSVAVAWRPSGGGELRNTVVSL